MSNKVYLVDDEPDLRRAIERLLRAEGFKVESHGSALEFLARLPTEADGCVVMDLAMPGLDGLDAQDRLLAASTRWLRRSQRIACMLPKPAATGSRS